MKVTKVKKNDISVFRCKHKADYVDTYFVSYNSKAIPSADDLQVGFWFDMPKIAIILLKIRNTLVKPFGLHTDFKDKLEKGEKCIRYGENTDFFSLHQKSDNETIVLLKDKHLDAYFSIIVNPINCVSSHNIEVYFTTKVFFKSVFGKLYFLIIYPFHCLLLKIMIKRLIKKKI